MLVILNLHMLVNVKLRSQQSKLYMNVATHYKLVRIRNQIFCLGDLLRVILFVKDIRL